MMKNYESMHKYMTEFDEAMFNKQGALNQINDALGALGHMSNTEAFNELYDEFYNQYYSMQDIVDRMNYRKNFLLFIACKESMDTQQMISIRHRQN